MYSFSANKNLSTSMYRFKPNQMMEAIKESIWEIPLPFIVLGGIYSGFFAISEAAAVTALYVFIIEVIVLKEIKLFELPIIMRESMLLVGGILLVLSVSLASTNYMIDSGVPERIFNVVSEVISSKYSFLVLLLLFLIILGALLDIFSAIVLVVPILLPIAAQYQIDPIHLGIVFLATMQLGYITPPVGINLFIASFRFEKSIIDVYSSTIPFFVILLFSVILITFWPTLTLILL
jgi:tripartite ATP-independent transporter DctM subunit